MKRIILGFSLLLMLAQNGFARTDAEYDVKIKEQKIEVNKQIWRCNKAALNHKYNSNPEVCIKAYNELEKEYPNEKDTIAVMALSSGLLFNYSKKNYMMAYQYYIKSAKFGNTIAQKNLDILCRKHSWVCK